MSEALVTIRTFMNSVQAGFCRGVLEENGFQVFLKNELAGAYIGFAAITIPIELQVPESEVEDALRVLDELAELPDDISDATADLVADAEPDEPMLPADRAAAASDALAARRPPPWWAYAFAGIGTGIFLWAVLALLAMLFRLGKAPT